MAKDLHRATDSSNRNVQALANVLQVTQTQIVSQEGHRVTLRTSRMNIIHLFDLPKTSL